MSTASIAPIPVPFILRQTASLAKKHWVLLLTLQLPEVSIELLTRVVSPAKEGRLIWGLLIVFPYFCIASFLSNALTFAAVTQAQAGEIDLGRVIRTVSDRVGVLIPVSLLAGLLIGMGILVLILPAIYFMTIYIFVPFLVLSLPTQPWSVYLFQSKQMSKRAFGLCLSTVIVILLTSLTIEYFLGVSDRAALLDNPMLLVQYLTMLFISALVGLFANVWLSLLFQTLTLPGASP